MNQVLPEGKPKLFEADTDRTNFLTISTEGASKNRIAKILPLFLGRLFFSEKLLKEPSPGSDYFFDAFYAVDTGQLSVFGSGYCRANIGTNVTVGTSLHLKKLSDRIVLVSHSIALFQKFFS
jgi:hypothetical protein